MKKETKNNIQMRKVKKRDLPKIIEIIRNSFHTRYAAAGEFYSVQQFVDPNYVSSAGPYYSLEIFIEDMIRGLKNKIRKPFDFFVAENNKEIVGFIVLENNSGNLWINNIMVRKNYQKKNIGKELFNFAAKNKKPIYLWVNTKNPAIQFWKNIGFKEILKESLMIRK